MKKINRALIVLVLIIALVSSSVYAAAPVDYKELAESKYKDVKKTDWFAEYVGKLTELNVINGYNGAYDPHGYMTRAQFAKVLVQAMGYKKIDAVSFDDIKPFPTSKAHWASVYIETALRNGILIKEEVGNKFFPDAPLLRKDMALMMCRALKLVPSAGANPFKDLSEPNGHITKLYEEYLIRGEIVNGIRLFNSEAMSSRAEVAAIISRIVDYKADPDEYVKTVGLKTRLKEGIATEEDLKLKRDMELQKQAEDKNYVVEPEFNTYRNETDFYYKNYYYSIKLDNYKDYADDVQIRSICISDKTQNSSYGQDAMLRWHETRSDVWRPLKQMKDNRNNTIGSVRMRNCKRVNGEYINYSYNYKPGTILLYEIQIIRGETTNKYPLSVVIP